MSARYDTDRYAGAAGLNWWTSDPTLQFQLRMHMPQRDYDWARPHLERFGGFAGGSRWPSGPSRPTATRPGSSVTTGGATTSTRSCCPSRSLLAAARSDSTTAPTPPSATTAQPTASTASAMCDDDSTCSTRPRSAWRARSAPAATWSSTWSGRFAPPDIREQVIAEVRVRRVGGRDHPVAHRTHRRLRSRRARDDRDARRRRVAPQRLQVVRVQRERQAWVVLAKPEGAPDSARGICDVPRAARAARRQPQRHPHPPAQGQARHARRSPRPRSSSSTPKRSCLRRPPCGETGAGDGKGLAR